MPACCYGLALYYSLGVQLKPKVREQTLESLAYTLNHIFLEDRKLRTYEQPNTTDSLMAAEPEAVYERKSQE